MGYREDQFYNLYSDALEQRSGNKSFRFPGSTSRKLTGLTNDSKTVKRGFITSLLFNNQTLGLTPNEEAKLKTRFNFQFNPSVIAQQVNNSEDMLLPLLQSPGNWATPVMSNNNFMFELFLDRQFEVNETLSDPGWRVGGEDLVEEFAKLDPRQVGVMADLAVLYRLIGQGLDATTLSIFKKLAERAQAYSSDTADESESASTVPITEGAGDQRTPIDQNINAGNYAFIAALPVRVVFSSLFMVDGFVTSTAVRFTKFNANMVPTQCTVSIAMQAMYVGFAREKTAFTFALSDDTPPAAPTPGTPSGGSNPTPGPKVGDPADAAKLKEFEDKILKRFRIAASDKFVNWPKYPNYALRTVYNADQDDDVIEYTLLGVLGGNWIYCAMGFPLLGDSPGDDMISKYFSEGNRMSLRYSFNLNITRPPWAPDEGGSSILLGAFSGSSSMAKDSGGGEIIDSEKKWKAARNIATTANQVVITKPTDSYYQNYLPEHLYLPNKASFEKFRDAGNKVKITLSFNMEVNLTSANQGSTSRIYNKVHRYEYKLDKPVFLDFTFDTIVSGPPSTIR